MPKGQEPGSESDVLLLVTNTEQMILSVSFISDQILGKSVIYYGYIYIYIHNI